MRKLKITTAYCSEPSRFLIRLSTLARKPVISIAETTGPALPLENAVNAIAPAQF